MTAARPAGAALALLLAACGSGEPAPGARASVARMLPLVGGKLDVVAGIARGLAAIDAPAAYAGPPLMLVEPRARGLAGDTLLAYAGDLTALAEDRAPVADAARAPDAHALIGCWYVIRRGERATFATTGPSAGALVTQPAHARDPAARCAALVHAQRLAVVTPAPGAASPGAATAGVVDIFDLRTGAHLGRRPFGAPAAQAAAPGAAARAIAAALRQGR